MARGRGKGKLVSKASPKPDTKKEANAEPKASEQVKKGEETPAAVSETGEKMEVEKKEEPKANSNNENNTLQKKKKLKKKNKTAGGDTSVGKAADKAKTSGSAGKGTKRAPGMGLIFMCNSQTKKDCYHYKILGLPASKKDIVAKVYKGMRLFLFDFDLRLMYGVYKAAGPGGYNIEPKAFKSAFPSQVRFTVLDDCLPLPEEKFKAAIKDNYYGKNKFNCDLTPEQVKNLCKLFRTQTEGGRPKQGGGRPAKREPRGFADEERYRRRPPLGVGLRPRLGPPRGPPAYERDPYPAPNFVNDRPLDLDYYRRKPLRPLGLRGRDERAYRDPYLYRETVGYREPLYSAARAPASAYAPLYRY